VVDLQKAIQRLFQQWIEGGAYTVVLSRPYSTAQACDKLLAWSTAVKETT
jgi:hypothetical protein